MGFRFREVLWLRGVRAAISGLVDFAVVLEVVSRRGFLRLFGLRS